MLVYTHFTQIRQDSLPLSVGQKGTCNICPKCGYVYSVEESINLGMGDDCEDVVYINCKKCNAELRVDSWFTEIRFLTRLSKEQK